MHFPGRHYRFFPFQALSLWKSLGSTPPPPIPLLLIFHTQKETHRADLRLRSFVKSKTNVRPWPEQLNSTKESIVQSEPVKVLYLHLNRSYQDENKIFWFAMDSPDEKRQQDILISMFWMLTGHMHSLQKTCYKSRKKKRQFQKLFTEGHTLVRQSMKTIYKSEYWALKQEFNSTRMKQEAQIRNLHNIHSVKCATFRFSDSEATAYTMVLPREKVFLITDYFPLCWDLIEGKRP